MHKKIIISIIVMLLAFSMSAAADEYFVIDHYQVDIDVMENNSYNIVETIDVNFQTERHGIYRTIPLRFDERRVKISNISVPGHETSVEKSRTEVNIRIGSADAYVKGKVAYTISYTYDVGADSLDDMDEFYHNIIGDQWDTPIAAVDFNIRMPKAFDPSLVNFTSGDYGSTDGSNVEWELSGNTISGRMKSPLRNYQSLTAALPLPEGYWVGAKTHREQGWLVFSIFGYPLYIAVIILAFIFWYKRGRDNKLFPSVEFEPPEGMNPSEIGYIIDGSVDNKDVTSLIIYWADKGCLEIEEETVGRAIFKKKKLHLTKLKDLDSDAKSYEKRVFNKLFDVFGDGKKVSTDDLTNKFYPTVSEAQRDIKKSFTDDPEKKIYAKGSRLFTGLTGLFAALPIIMILMEGFLPLTGSGPIVLLAVPFSLFLIIPSMMIGSAVTKGGDGSRGTIVFALLFGGFSFIFFGLFTVYSAGVPIYKYLAAVGSGIIVNVFVNIMSKRTEYGDRILEKTLGFKEFIKEAEKDKLELMFESNPSYFYRILPYAMVLNLSDKWSAHFDGIAVEPPSWYRGYGHTTFNTRTFTSSLNGSFSTLNSSMNSSPSSGSGGSSSGGSSGGGSGGGGGGSW